MSHLTDNPIVLQSRIVDCVRDRQTDTEPVCDRDIASDVGTDLPTLRVHLEMLAAEGRIELVRGETEYHARAAAGQEGEAAVPPHLVLHQRMERFVDRLRTIHDAVRRAAAWAPLILMVGGAAAGWFGTNPPMRTETAFYMGVFGLLIGLMLREEIAR